MPLTLAQMAKTKQPKLRKGIIMNLLRQGNLLQYVPFEGVDSLTNTAIRWTALPTVAFRRINQGYTESSGDVEAVQESVYAFGGEIELDRVWSKVKGPHIVDPIKMQIQMKTLAMYYKFVDYFVNGDHASDPDGFEGLKKRISNMPSRQSVRASKTTDVLDPTTDAASGAHFVDKFDEAYGRANGGQPNIILCNEGMYWGLGRILRRLTSGGGSLLGTQKDMFGRDVLSYKGVPLVDIGIKADQSTEIITNSETAEDAGTDATSVYFVPFDMEQGVHGIQLDPLEVYDPLSGGERESKPTKLIRVEWWCGLAGFGSYGPVRLHNIETPASWT